MKNDRIVCSVLAIALVLALFSGCAKKEDGPQEQSDTNSESSSRSSTVAHQGNEHEAATPKTSTADAPGETGNAEDRLQKQQDEVRQAFVSLQQACKAKDIDTCIAFWDDETKMAIEPRDLDVNERRARRRNNWKPERYQKIADAKIESITIDTSKAESIKHFFGVDLEGTMMLVHTDGPDLFFHETDKGWKLYSTHY